MAKLSFKYKDVVFTVKDVGDEDEESLIFSPQDMADKFNFDELFTAFMLEHEKEFSVDGVYWPSIDPTDNWSRRKFFAESIGAKILKYVPVEYPPDAVF